MGFGEKILKYQDEILRNLAVLVAIPSVRGPKEAGMPFGKAPAEALNCILEMAQRMGLETKNIDNVAGHAEYGSGEEIAAVLAHVDVVPAGEGWETDPFSLVCRDGLAFGRGTADDKGAAIVALMCLKILKEEGIAAKRRLRVVFGAGEETGSEDLELYFQKEPLPIMGFTPDAAYGICNREKGILQVSLSAKENKRPLLLEFEAGDAVNAVPSKALAQLCCSAQQVDELENAAKTAAGDFTVVRTQQGASVVSVGRASHAMQPQEGFNAATHLLALLERVFGRESLGTLAAFCCQAIGTELDGSALHIACRDEESGVLTCSLNVVHINAQAAEAHLDIRYPVTADGGAIWNTIQEQAAASGVLACSAMHNPPLYLPANSPFIGLLQDAYQSVTGKQAELYATGGGTYARSLQCRGAAFGPLFPDEPDRRLHNTNEHIEMKRFMEHAQICLEAMYRMLTADTSQWEGNDR